MNITDNIRCFYRAAFITVLKICNVLLSIIGHIICRIADSTRIFLSEVNPQNEDNFNVNATSLRLIRDAFFSLPVQNTDMAMRSVLACKVAQKFIDEVGEPFSTDISLRVYRCSESRV